MGEAEGRVERYLVMKVSYLGGLAPKFTSPGLSGVPDRICSAPGKRTVLVECKAPGERLRPLQKHVHDMLAKAGFTIFTVGSEAQVEDFIRAWQ